MFWVILPYGLKYVTNDSIFSERLHKLNSDIPVFRHHVAALPRTSPIRVGGIQALATLLNERYNLSGQVDDLEQSILTTQKRYSFRTIAIDSGRTSPKFSLPLRNSFLSVQLTLDTQKMLSIPLSTYGISTDSLLKRSISHPIWSKRSFCMRWRSKPGWSLET